MHLNFIFASSARTAASISLSGALYVLRVLDVLHIRDNSLLPGLATLGIGVVGNVVVLQLLRPGISGNRVPDAALDDISFKQQVDRLQRHVLRLRHAEDRIDAHHDAACPE